MITGCVEIKNNLIIGDWVEVRRETRLGYVYSTEGALLEPFTMYRFLKNGEVIWYNSHNFDKKNSFKYYFYNDSIIYIYRKIDINYLDKDSLILCFHLFPDVIDNDDQKCYFIHIDKYNKLSKLEKEEYKSPSIKDKIYLDSIIERRNNKIKELKNQPIYPIIVEKMPEFSGGKEALNDFIKSNLICPSSFKGEGNVYVTFKIENDGTISDVKILKGLSPDCDKEALRLIRIMPRWISGEQNGKKVGVQFNLPIKFKN